MQEKRIIPHCYGIIRDLASNSKEFPVKSTIDRAKMQVESWRLWLCGLAASLARAGLPSRYAVYEHSGLSSPFARYLLLVCLAAPILAPIALAADRDDLRSLAEAHFGKTPPVTYPDALLRGLYPNQNLAEVKVMLRETWTDRPLIFQAYTHVREAPFTGKFVQVSPDGFRRVKNQGAFPPNPNRKAVFLFGGSTQFGYGVRDDQTIASYLQDLLDGSFPGQFSAYNFGVGYDYVGQYRIRLEHLLRHRIIPPVVVTLNGINEEPFLCGTNNHPFAALQPVERSKYLLQNNLALLLNRHWRIDIKNLLGRGDDPFFGREYGFPKDPQSCRRYPAFLEKLFRAEKIIAGYGKRYGFKTLSVFQPQPFLERARWNKKDIKAKLANQFPAHIEYIEASRKEHGSGFLSLLDFDGPGAIDYVDQLHYSARMNQAIATAIFEQLARVLALNSSKPGVRQ